MRGCFSQKGFSQIILIGLIVLGIGVGIWQIKKYQTLSSSASEDTRLNISEAFCDDRVPVVGLYWPQYGSVQEYQVYRNEDLIATVRGTSFADRTGLPSTAYYYRVYAKVTNPVFMGIVSITTSPCVSGMGTCTNLGRCLEKHGYDLSGNECTGGTLVGQLDCPESYPYCMKGTTCTETCIGKGGLCLDESGKDSVGNICTGGRVLGKLNCAGNMSCTLGASCSAPSSSAVVSPIAKCVDRGGVCTNNLGHSGEGQVCTGQSVGRYDCPADKPYCVLKESCRIVTSSPLPSPSPSLSSQSIKVMPLGDSITAGLGDGGTVSTISGYRDTLGYNFKSYGYNVDFVGSQSSGILTMPDKDHEGHINATIDTLSSQIDTWLGIYKPDMVVLLVGINNISLGDSGTVTLNKMDLFVDKMTSKLPNTTILVSSLLPTSRDNLKSGVAEFNGGIEQLITSKKNSGKKVSYVNLNSKLSIDDLDDGLHPNKFGYQKLGNALFMEMAAIFKATPVGTVPTSCTQRGGFCLNKLNITRENMICSGGTHVGQLDCPAEYPYCYENISCNLVSSPSPEGKIGDLDKDGDVDIFDFNYFLQDIKNNNARSDFNNSGKVDIFDFNILLKNFGR